MAKNIKQKASQGTTKMTPPQDGKLEPTSELIHRAESFVKEFENAERENSESQTFWNEFFKVFGLNRRDVAKFEEHVRIIDSEPGSPPNRIDVFWPKVLLVEQKSAGKDLDKADEQAMKYYENLSPLIKPKYIMSSDFKTIHLQKIGSDPIEFSIVDFVKYLPEFGFMLGKDKFEFEEHVSIKAANHMKIIHDLIWNSNHPREVEYKNRIIEEHKTAVEKAKEDGKKPPKLPSLVMPKTDEEIEQDKKDKEILSRFLTRISYCLFAEDAGIFKQRQFIEYIMRKTESDPTQLGGVLQKLFTVLNQEIRNDIIKKDNPDLDAFPYIDGKLFENDGSEKQIDCNNEIRDAIIKAASFDWSFVSPSVFGSMFESVMDTHERRESGSHYTTTENVLKVINPLFMNDLWSEYDEIINSKLSDSVIERKLISFQEKLGKLMFLDPACGSGSFLITSYSEIRKLEFEVITKIHQNKALTNSTIRSVVDVNQFHGIELNPFPAKIAETAMWMVDHLENQKLFRIFGGDQIRIPLEKHANINTADALEIDWNDVLPSGECDYIIGNPPFGGSSVAGNTNEQSARITGHKKIDYVANWFVKSARYVRDDAGVGLVATNSIVQGEQVGKLWPTILDDCGMSITFAHDSFKWKTDAKGAASVIVVIIGMSKSPSKGGRLYDEAGGFTEHAYISPYLKGFTKQMPIVHPASKPLNGLAPLINGTQPNDGTKTIFTEDEMREFIKKEPGAEPLMREFVSGKSFIQGQKRWILDARNLEPSRLKTMKHVMGRLKAVSKARQKSPKAATRELARTPAEWAVTVVPTKQFLGVPRVSSETREYIPIGFLEPPAIPMDKIMVVQEGGKPLFGLLTSKMHMAWVKLVSGRLKSDFSYSGNVYNAFPVPKGNMASLEKYAQAVLDARANHSGSTLADLYGKFMPADLRKAHDALDRAVDLLYREEPFGSDQERWEYLLGLYEKMVNKQKKLEVEKKKPKSGKSKTNKSKASKTDKNTRVSTKRHKRKMAETATK